MSEVMSDGESESALASAFILVAEALERGLELPDAVGAAAGGATNLSVSEVLQEFERQLRGGTGLVLALEVSNELLGRPFVKVLQATEGSPEGFRAASVAYRYVGEVRRQTSALAKAQLELRRELAESDALVVAAVLAELVACGTPLYQALLDAAAVAPASFAWVERLARRIVAGAPVEHALCDISLPAWLHEALVQGCAHDDLVERLNLGIQRRVQERGRIVEGLGRTW